MDLAISKPIGPNSGQQIWKVLRAWHQFLFTKRNNQKPMNLLLIILCFVLAYGLFALIAFKIVKVLFPNSDSHDKPWKVRTP